MSVFNGERFRIECLRTVLINTHFIEAAYRAGLERYFFSFPACAYNRELQKEPNARDLKEADVAFRDLASLLVKGEKGWLL